MVQIFAFSLVDQLDRYGAVVALLAFAGLAFLALLQFVQARELKVTTGWAEKTQAQIAEFEQSLLNQRQQIHRLEEQVAAKAHATDIDKTAIVRPQPFVPPIKKIQAKIEELTDQPTEAHDFAEMAKAILGEDSEAKASEALPAGSKQPDIGSGPVEADVPAAVQSALGAPSRESTTTVASGVADASRVREEKQLNLDDKPGPLESPHYLESSLRSARKKRPPAAALRHSGRTATAPRHGGSGVKGGRRARPSGRSRLRRLVLTLSAVLAVGASATFIATMLFSGDSEKPKIEAMKVRQTREAQRRTPQLAPINRSETTVAVLNGTTITGLASTISTQLQRAGFKPGATATHTDQSHISSTVFFKHSFGRQAKEVARILKISDIRPIDREDQALAGEDAQVMVLVGADQAP